MTAPVRLLGMPPIANRFVQVIIMGSMPGEKSLAMKEYYAHPRNQFWKIMSAIINVNLSVMTYSERYKILLNAHIGIWDVIQTCERVGSLDASICCSIANQFEDIKQRCPKLRLYAFNGQKAAKIGRTIFKPSVSLPSSSGTYCAMPLNEKISVWTSELRRVFHNS